MVDSPVAQPADIVDDRLLLEIGYYVLNDPAGRLPAVWGSEMCSDGDPMVLDSPNATLVDYYRAHDGAVPRVGEYVVIGEPIWRPAPGVDTKTPVAGRVVAVLHHITPISGMERRRERTISVFLTPADLGAGIALAE
jgi:hypothetical protein